MTSGTDATTNRIDPMRQSRDRKREIRGKQLSCRFAFRVFSVFRNFDRRGNCSQAADNLV